MISRPLKFRYDGADYPFETFSASGPDPKQLGNVCLRYEVLNTGPDIPYFYWNLLEDESFTLTSGSRPASQVSEPTVHAVAVPADSLITAFRNKTTATKVHRTVEQVARDQTAASQSPDNQPNFRIRVLSIEKSFPAVAELLENSNIAATSVLSYQLQNDSQQEFNYLEKQVMLAGGNFFFRSVAFFDGKEFRVDTSLEVKSESRAMVFSPLVLGLGTYSDVDNFVANLAALRKIPLEVAESGKYFSKISFPRSRVIGSDLQERPTLYIVQHPVSIQGRDWYGCIRVSSYSPFPVSINSDYCGK